MKIFTESLNKTKRAFFLATLAINVSYAQQNLKPAIESFEKEAVLNEYKTVNSTVSTSNDHYKYGKNSLKWTWTDTASVSTSNFRFLTLDESPLDYGDFFPASPTLQMNLYNENPSEGEITIAYKKDGKEEVYFNLPLNFKGWRTIWVPMYEMKGNTPKKGASVDYNGFKISTNTKSGTLFFDDISFGQFQDDRHQYPDEFVPFIKEDQDLGKDHWMPLIVNYDRIKNLKPEPISYATRIDLKKFEQKLDADMEIPKKYKLYINSVREDYNKLQLTDNGEFVNGPPLIFRREQYVYDKEQQGKDIFNDIKDLGKVMKKIATFVDRGNAEEKAELEQMYLTATKYYIDQGWVAGSNGGTRHHIGYAVRQITESFFMMRGLLYKNGLLDEVAGSLHWLFNLGMLLDNPENFHINIDYLNTQSYYHLMMIFLFEKQEKQAALLSAYSNYISTTLAQQKEEWGFKVDGTAWHHNGHYPAYGIGAFSSVPKIIKTLSGTRFRIGTKGHKNFRKAFLASRIYSQTYNWGFGNAGRHPLQNDGIDRLKNQFLDMAYAGNPEGTSKIDKEVASAYLRLWGKDDMLNTSLFTKVNGIQKEELSGYYTFPYGATAVHRRNNWAALIKGYSKYVWASEIYVTSNRYGRYPANGTIQLLNEAGEVGSGFKQEGWDWNIYPGATVIHLPLTELEPKTPLIMFRSNETFAGSTTLGDNGVFGMILNEGKGSNADGDDRETNIGFPGRLYAKKSVFSFGDKLICIGTDISSIDPKNPTQTNLFQTFLKDSKDPIITSEHAIRKFPFKGELEKNNERKNWIVDPYGNGYHILSNNTVQFKKEKQHSYHNKYSLSTGQIDKAAKGVKETESDYATAWLNHGLAPKDASYQYVIYPFLEEVDQKNFDKKTKNDKTYTILKADSVAHIVKDEKTNTIGYVVFEADTNLENGILKSVSEPALVMARKNSVNEMLLSVVQPDLNFPEYKKGRFRNYSQAVELKITFEGKWSADTNDFIKAIDNIGANTTITLECINGLPREFNLNKV